MKYKQSFHDQSDSFPNLAKEEEFQAFQFWHKKSSLADRNRIILSYLKLVKKMARNQSQRSCCEFDGLVSEGILGLFRALQSFDSQRDIRFSTYASFWIRAYMQDYIFNSLSVVRRTSTQRRVKSKDSCLEKFCVDLGSWKDVSLDKEVDCWGEGTSWLESIPDERETPEEYVLYSMDAFKKKSELFRAMTILKDIEKKVIMLRYGGEIWKSLEKVAQSIGITAEGVRQIEKRALKKLQKAVHPYR